MSVIGIRTQVLTGAQQAPYPLSISLVLCSEFLLAVAIVLSFICKLLLDKICRMRDIGRKDRCELSVQASKLLKFQMNECSHSELQSEHWGEQLSIFNKPSLLKPVLVPDTEQWEPKW